MTTCRWGCGQPPHDEEPCTDEKPCRCCRMLDNPRAEAAEAERDELTAIVQRVREACAEYVWWLDVGEHAGTNDRGELPFIETHMILRALDGGESGE